MQFTRFIAALSVFSLVAALPAPAAVQERGVVAIPDVLGSLQTKVHASLAQVDSLVADGGLTQAAVGPLFDQVVSALQQASVELGSVVNSVPISLPIRRQVQAQVDAQEVATILSAVVTDINTTLGSLVGTVEQVPGVTTLIVGVNTSLTQVLAITESLVPGVLVLVSGVVGTLTATLGQLLGALGLGSLLGSLGL